jgi:TonB family protein
MRAIIAPFLLLAGTATVHAQHLYGEGATFAEGPARHEVAGELTYIDVPEPCVLWVNIGVDRNGKVVSAEVDKKTTTCVDTAVHAKALRSVRGRAFNAEPKAPAVQRGRVQWTFRQPEWDLITVEPVAIVEEDHDPNEPLVIAQEMPEFPGGQDALMKYVAKSIKYPDDALESGIHGTVFVSFVVETDGRITEVKVLRGIRGGCDEEALRVMKGMPSWKPGKQNGKLVRVRYNLPIRFKLQEDAPKK